MINPIDLTTEAQRIARLMSAHDTTLSVAESCTGGAIASALTLIPGASSWFEAGVVAYTFDAKAGLLGCSVPVLSKGLITQATAMEMVTHVAQAANTPNAIATTGICGPSGDEGHTPLTAWIAAMVNGFITTLFVEEEDHGREANIQRVTGLAMQLFADTYEHALEKGGIPC